MSFGDEIGLIFKIKADGSQALGEIGKFRSTVDKELQSIASSFASGAGGVGTFAAALGPVGLGLGSVAGLAVTAGTAIFGLAEKTASAEAKLWDMSQRTNFSVETLSALKTALENSGGSLDRFQQGLVFFQKNIESANEGNKKLSAAFHALNIDTRDNETALRSAFTQLSKITDGTQQAALAQKLFRGSAKDVLGVIKESHGDFDAYTERLRKMGFVISTEAAAKADQFRDSLHILSLEAEAAGRQLADEVIPEITGAMQDLTSATLNNGSVFQEWGRDIADATQFARVLVETLRNLETWDSGQDVSRKFDEATRKIVRSDDISSGRLIVPLDQMTPEQQQQARDRSDRELRRAYAGAGMPFPTEGIDPAKLGGGKSGADKARQEAIRQLEQDQKQTEEDYRRNTQALQREYDLQLTSSQTFTKGLVDDANDRYEKLKASLDKQRALEKTESGKDKVDNEIQKAKDARDKTVEQAKDAQDKREIDSLKTHREALLKLGETYDAESTAAIESNADLGAITYEDAENRKFNIQTAAYNRRLNALQDDEAAFYKASKDANDVNLEEAQKFSDAAAQIVEEQEKNQQQHDRDTDAARQKDIQREREYRQTMKQLREQAVADDIAIQRMEIEAAAAGNRNPSIAQRTTIIKALADVDRAAENQRHAQALEDIENLKKENLARAKTDDERLEAKKIYDRELENEARLHAQKMGEIQTKQQQADDDANPLHGALDELKKTTKVTDFVANQAAAGLLKMRDAFGQAIEANLLYGASIGKALKAALAEYLAHASAEAAIETLRQAAWALASLAFGDFGGAARHAAAAAAFGALALGAGAAASSLAKSAGLRVVGHLQV
jgi:hypothetical protein